MPNSRSKVSTALPLPQIYLDIPCPSLIHWDNGALCGRSIQLAESHAGDLQVLGFSHILQDWKLPTDCLSAATMDNGWNIAMAMEILGTSCVLKWR